MIKDKIKQALAQLEFINKNKGLHVTKVNVGVIPNTWEFFNGTTDLWRKVDYDNEDLTGCLYKPQKENTFKSHVHDYSDEMIMNITPNTKFTVYTPRWSKTIAYGESVFIPRKLPHLVEWNNDDMMLNIIWHPMMKEWEANFIKE